MEKSESAVPCASSNDDKLQREKALNAALDYARHAPQYMLSASDILGIAIIFNSFVEGK